MLANSLILLAPGTGVPSKFIMGSRQIVYMAALQLCQLPRMAAMGDMFRGKPMQIAENLAFDQAIFPMCKITAPLIGAALVARSGLRQPFAASVLMFCGQLALSSIVKETHHATTAFAIGAISPFGFLKLFRRGRTMKTLAVMQMIATVAETGGQPTPAEQVANIHKANLLGWGVPERSRYESKHTTPPAVAL